VGPLRIQFDVCLNRREAPVSVYDIVSESVTNNDIFMTSGMSVEHLQSVQMQNRFLTILIYRLFLARLSGLRSLRNSSVRLQIKK
jgi:hypothetical protein